MSTENQVEKDFRNVLSELKIEKEIENNIVHKLMIVSLGLIQKFDKYNEIEIGLDKFYNDDYEGNLCDIGEYVAGKFGYL